MYPDISSEVSKVTEKEGNGEGHTVTSHEGRRRRTTTSVDAGYCHPFRPFSAQLLLISQPPSWLTIVNGIEESNSTTTLLLPGGIKALVPPVTTTIIQKESAGNITLVYVF